MPSSGHDSEIRRVIRDLSDHGDEGGAAGSGLAFLNHPRYQIQARLGEGTSAVVYRAWDTHLKRPVAFKLLRQTMGSSEVARERFRREAQTAAGLVHPNVVVVHDSGEAQGQFYLVMELLEGRPLSDLLQERKTPLEELLRILRDAARGVAAAHGRGIVHRDLKPANLLITSAGEPKVVDFGLAHLDGAGQALTRTGAALGTPLYMSPEQVEGRVDAISPRTDVYALGAILYEMLVGHPPHQGEILSELYRRILNEDPVKPRTLHGRIPRDLETIALQSLERDPDKRYASAQEFAEDLGRYLEGEPILARPPSPARRIWNRVQKHRRILTLTVLVAGLGALGGGWAISRLSRSGLPETTDRARAQTALGLARDFALSQPDRLDDAIRLWQQALAVSKEPEDISEATRAIDDLGKRRLAAHDQERQSLEASLALPLQNEQFRAVLGTPEEAAKRHDTPAWTRAIRARMAEVERRPQQLYPEIKTHALFAKTRGAVEESDALLARVRQWGYPELARELDRELAAILAPDPIPEGATELIRFPYPGPRKYNLRGELKEGILKATASDSTTNSLGLENGVVLFRSPKEGEIRMIYKITQPAPIRFRVRAGPKAFEWTLKNPEVGHPARAKVPFSYFETSDHQLIAEGTVIDNFYVLTPLPGPDFFASEIVVIKTK